jgi:eukaryotic-like serine/threonine-protein kinase
VSELPILPRVGDTVDRYRVISEVAHGGMAAVYAVQRSSIGGFEKLLAMKVMLPHLATNAHFVDMFLDEARIASQIQHPNVVQVLDVGQHERMPFILMEFLRGQSLSRLLHRVRESQASVPIQVWLAILAQAAEGLHAAHETFGADGLALGIVHRDVSPHNVFVGYDGQVKVVDFGIAAARGRLSGTHSGEVKGKLAYLAPEQLDRTGPLTRATDIWALGVVAWEIFAGKRLFASKDEANTIWNVLNQPVEDIERLVPRLPESAARVLMASLSRQAGRRPATAKEVARVYQAAANDLGTGRDAASVMERLFAGERGVETERLAAAQRQGPPPPLRESDPTSDEALGARPLSATESSNTQLSSSAFVRRVRRSSLRNTLLVLGGLLAIGLGASYVRFGQTQSEPQPASTVTTEPKTAVRVTIDERARLVLVNGTRHDERPLSLQLGPKEEAIVEVVGANGEMVRRAVKASDDGVLVALPAALPVVPASSAPTPATPTFQRAPAKPKSAAPLMKNPF